MISAGDGHGSARELVLRTFCQSGQLSLLEKLPCPSTHTRMKLHYEDFRKKETSARLRPEIVSVAVEDCENHALVSEREHQRDQCSGHAHGHTHQHLRLKSRTPVIHILRNITRFDHVLTNTETPMTGQMSISDSEHTSSYTVKFESVCTLECLSFMVTSQIAEAKHPQYGQALNHVRNAKKQRFLTWSKRASSISALMIGDRVVSLISCSR